MKLINGDCLEEMKNTPDGSVDMILADPPYGTTACKWDSVIDLGLMWLQLKRIIKPNGAIVMTASQPFTTTLISSNINNYRHSWVWVKSRATGFQRVKHEPLRNTEDVCVFIISEDINSAVSNEHSAAAKREIREAFKESALRNDEFNSLCGFEASGYLRTSSSWANVLPTGEKLIKINKVLSSNISEHGNPYKRTFNHQGIISCSKINNRGGAGQNWSELKSNNYTQKIENYPTQVLTFKSEGKTKHPTQKPVALMEYLIKTYTNEGETVLDFAMGSGTTGVACKNLNRDFIGIELDEKYFEIAKERIKLALTL